MMPDLLTHVLVAYVITSPIMARFDFITTRIVPVVMAGALIPDAVKLNILLPHYEVEAILGVPFRWFPLASLGGSLVTAGIIAIFVTADHRKNVFAALVAGAGLHIFLDALIKKPGPTTPPKLYPFTLWEPLTVGFYLSSDLSPWMVATIFAAIVITGKCVQTELTEGNS